MDETLTTRAALRPLDVVISRHAPYFLRATPDGLAEFAEPLNRKRVLSRIAAIGDVTRDKHAIAPPQILDDYRGIANHAPSQLCVAIIVVPVPPMVEVDVADMHKHTAASLH